MKKGDNTPEMIYSREEVVRLAKAVANLLDSYLSKQARCATLPCRLYFAGTAGAAWNVIWLVIVPAFRQLVLCHLYSVRQPAQNGMAGRVMEPPEKYLEHIKNI